MAVSVYKPGHAFRVITCRGRSLPPAPRRTSPFPPNPTFTSPSLPSLPSHNHSSNLATTHTRTRLTFSDTLFPPPPQTHRTMSAPPAPLPVSPFPRPRCPPACDGLVFLRCIVGDGVLGGKGGFGASLKAAAKGKKTTNFGMCRDLNGRRLRHVNDEMRLRLWMKEKAMKDKVRYRLLYNTVQYSFPRFGGTPALLHCTAFHCERSERTVPCPFNILFESVAWAPGLCSLPCPAASPCALIPSFHLWFQEIRDSKRDNVELDLQCVQCSWFALHPPPNPLCTVALTR